MGGSRRSVYSLASTGVHGWIVFQEGRGMASCLASLLCPLRASTQDNTLVSGVCYDGYPARSTTSTPGTMPSSSLALEPVQGHPGRYPGMVVQNRLEHGQ